MMILSRSVEKEIMDDPSIQDERLDETLRELTGVARRLGGLATSREGVRNVLAHFPPKESYSVLDVGAGGSDVVEALSSFRAGMKITVLDFNARACEYSARRFPFITVVHGSVFDLPFEEESFDVVHASLFLHHCTEDELHVLLPKLYSIARYGIVINDLRRSLVAYAGIAMLTRLFSRSAMVKHDAPLSVRRGFARNELAQFCAMLPSARTTIRRRWAFRWLVCVVKRK
jgi:2-polyprenyl-3-methyl-5-hydroxy-6-metoxy-1,4-benzoquinol methylase